MATFFSLKSEAFDEDRMTHTKRRTFTHSKQASKIELATKQNKEEWEWEKGKHKCLMQTYSIR